MHEVPAIAELALDDLIGQVVCFGWSDITPGDARGLNRHAEALVEEMRVGSIVLMGRNVGEPESLRDLLAQMQARSRIPLLIQVDQEGGRVNRLPRPFHQFPSNRALGRIPGERGVELARRQGFAVARELRAVGINWLAAPVLDVNVNPANPVIGDRSYGEDPERVGALGEAFIRGCQAEGVLAGAKHFPGHGDTDVDSHLDLPVIRGSRERLERVELPPFRRAVSAGVRTIMTAHILFPALDPDRPATLSPAILTGLLREEMGFDGVLVTDCLEMQAIARGPGTARGAVEAVKAGADVVLVCHTLQTQREVLRAIREALDSGEIAESRLREAADRVLQAKKWLAAQPLLEEEQPWRNPRHDALEAEIRRLGGESPQ